MKTSLVFLTFLLITLSACSSGPSVKYTMDDTERPKWARTNAGFYEEGKDIVFVGIFETRRTSDLNMNAVRESSDMSVSDQIALKILTDYARDTGKTLDDLRGDEKFNSNARLTTKAVVKNTGIAGRWYRVMEDKIGDEEIEKIEHFSMIRLPRSKFMKLVKENNQ